jgi:serine protease AprX
VGGIRSITKAGSGEDLGTSFAAPLVSRSLAQIYHQITPTPSPVLARALLTHHARDPRSNGRVPTGDENFFGFGRPTPPPYCLACEPHQSTLIFDDALRPGFFLEWNDFPFPPSLYRDGKFFGEIYMTIAFSPARGARWGTEYCETHIDAHFGVYRKVTSRKDKKVSEKFVGLVPPEHANPAKLFEEVQIKELRKWAPVRTYHGDLTKGERGDRWRLMVRLLTRHGAGDREALQSQPFALIVTIADPTKSAPVYDEMAQLIRNQYKAQNLTVRASARIRSRN